METPIADPVPVRKDSNSLRSQPTCNQRDDSFVASKLNRHDATALELSMQVATHQHVARFSQFVLRLIAILLTVTAVAKLWMLLTDPFADVRVGLPKEILWLSVAFELWLAYENIRIRDYRVLSFINTIVFASFGIVAAIRWSLGYTSCGCSGSLELPPWVFLLIDVGIVSWFAGNYAQRCRLIAGWNFLRRIWLGWSFEARGRVAGLTVSSAILIGLQLPFASTLRAMILGEPPIIPVVWTDSQLRISEVSTGHVEILNRSSQSTKIIGVSRSCQCVDLSEDPISKIIRAYEKVSIPLIVKPKNIGRLHQRITLFLDHPKQFRVNIDVLGSVRGEE